ncbi:FAD-dependent oxidoreductase [Telmatospirillum sp. J64-1]|uniref:FAD-dependent oxidoreductase n=1 Tax=Telmatospirillum sp. J64-1 TaxID=2502183 RepID=UPI00115E320C|nr:FAD-dependent oxidoreductase [Telmatospirillum sp. J64-1]
MAQENARRGSFWDVGTVPAVYPRLDGDRTADVVVVGGGIAGLTAAWHLAEAGQRVLLLEAQRIGRQVTGHSTAKVTTQHGLIYTDLIERFGTEGAYAYAEANRWALEEIAETVAQLGIDCAFERKDAYLYTDDESRRPELEAEVVAAQRFRLPACLVEDLPVPVPHKLGIRFSDQAQFNPVAYADGLARAVVQAGGNIFEQTRVTSVEEGNPCGVVTEGGRIEAGAVVLATNIPFGKTGEFHKKARPRCHVGLAARIAEPFPEGMFLSLDSPTHSLRMAPTDQGPVLVAIGDGFKPGSADPGAKLRALETFVREAFSLQDITHVWWNEDFDSIDRVPFIGRASRESENLYVCTGFSSWGFTNGTAAGRIICDLILGRENAWSFLFDATREPHGERQRGHDEPAVQKDRDPNTLAKEEAALIEKGEQILAAYRDEAGELHIRSAACTHLGCTLAWNGVNRTWNCPCHGSAFDYRGKLVHGPAVKDLEPVDAGQGRGGA